MSDRDDVLKVEVEVKVYEGALNLKRIENAVRIAKMNLCHYIGYPLDSEVDVAESSLPESGSVSGSTAISGRPEYQMLDKKVQAAAQQVRMARADALPQAGIFAGYGYTHGRPSTMRHSSTRPVSVSVPRSASRSSTSASISESSNKTILIFPAVAFNTLVL